MQLKKILKNSENKQEEYDKLKEQALSCSKCDLGCSKSIDGYDQHVFGSGNLNSNIMFVAENPAYFETVQKKCLSPLGVSGKMYERILKFLKLSRNNVYTTNVLVCKSSNNRDAEPWEVLKCRPYLEHQLKLVDPKIVVTFGRFAAQALLGQFIITREHGQLCESKQFNVKVFPLYHPAYIKAYASRDKREEFKADVKKLKKILNELE